MRASFDDLLDIIDQIYAAPVIQGGWQNPLQAITRFFGAHASTFTGTYSNEKIFQPTYILSDQKNEEAMRDYAAYYHKICERGRYSRREAVGSVYFDQKYFSESQIQHNEYYNFIMRHGGKYAMGTTLARPDAALGTRGTQQCAVHFAPEQGHPDEETITLFQRLVPHMIRANQLHQKFKREDTALRGMTAAFDKLPDAVFGLDAKARIKFANLSAEHILAECDGIASKNDKLLFSHPLTHKRFGAALNAIAKKDELISTKQSEPIVVKRPSGAPPFVLLVAPTSRPETFGDDMAPDLVKYLVVLSEPQAPLRVSTHDLTRIYELTPSESDLTVALANGLSLNAYCEMKGISVETARWHLGNVFSKTNTHRQADLIRIVCNISLPRP